MKTIDVLAQTRRVVEAATRPLSEEQRSTLPPGFTNHILWNVGHLVVTQQLLCYKFSGLELGCDPALIRLFAKGSSPRDWGPDDVIPTYDELIADLHRLAAQLRTDYDAGTFRDFETYQTSAGVTLESAEDAIVFNNFHEGIHLGYILALTRAVKAAS